MDFRTKLTWLAITKLALTKIKQDLKPTTGTAITSSDISVLMFILEKMDRKNQFKTPGQKQISTKLNISSHRISIAFSILSAKGYIIRTDKPKTYLINPYMFYFGDLALLAGKRDKWNNLTAKNQIDDGMDKIKNELQQKLNLD